MQLPEDEWHKMTDLEGNPVTFGNPGCLRRPDGTLPDGFEESQEDEVINVVRIPIVVQAVREGVQYLPLEDSREVKRPHALVAVAGDEIVHGLKTGRFVGLHLDAMKEYNDFLMKLQNSEHDKRSIPILNQSGTPEVLDWLLSKAGTVPDRVAVQWLVAAMAQIAERLEQRADWAFPPVINVEPQLRIVLRQLDPATLREMAVSFPWPTREMDGVEVLPVRAMKPKEKQMWLAGLWSLVKDEVQETTKATAARARSRSPSASVTSGSASRFEAPRGFTPSRMESTLRRSHALRMLSPSVSEQTLAVPGAETDLSSRARRRSMGETLAVPGVVSPARGDLELVRLMSVRKPSQTVLTDAMQPALFRVGE
ncbi:hypothetical protein B0T11DRAFT_357992 [Plectosphaerella cucumerina]|uniref:Uncharacterized protein n=1 Tax=Plectosphaerella cucumerina TaxID=40658 RepID=A0A8K0TFJ3_9PEZI|nr:hypothetical protein B0T11DRAFT_357992 [Plectosphaerella cucumerina]